MPARRRRASHRSPPVTAMPAQASPRMTSSAGSPRAMWAPLAHRVADVAEHEEIAGRGAGESGEIVGRAGDEAVAKLLPCAIRCARGCAAPPRPRARQRRVDRHAALARELEEARGKVGIVGRERVLDLGAGDVGRQRLGDGIIGESDRIVLDREEVRGIEAARREPDRRDAEERGCRSMYRGRSRPETHRCTVSLNVRVAAIVTTARERHR